MISLNFFVLCNQQFKTQSHFSPHVWHRKVSNQHIWEGGNKQMFGILLYKWLKRINWNNCCGSISKTVGKPGAKSLHIHICLHPLTSVYFFLYFSPGCLYMKAQPGECRLFLSLTSGTLPLERSQASPLSPFSCLSYVDVCCPSSCPCPHRHSVEQLVLWLYIK